MDFSTALSYDEIVGVTAALKKGFVILYPTDTIWGLGCDMTNQSAVKRIFEIKQRDPDKSFILLVDSLAMLKRYVPNLHPRIETLLAYHQKPLTLVYDQFLNIPDHLVSSDGTVAIRICMDPFCQSVISEFGKPIVSTSANISGDPYPRLYSEISEAIKNKVDYIVEYGRDFMEERQPSVVARFNRKGDLDFLRE